MRRDVAIRSHFIKDMTDKLHLLGDSHDSTPFLVIAAPSFWMWTRLYRHSRVKLFPDPMQEFRSLSL